MNHQSEEPSHYSNSSHILPVEVSNSSSIPFLPNNASHNSTRSILNELNRPSLQIIKGSILEIKVGAIINSTDLVINMDEAVGVCKVIAEKAQKKYWVAYNSKDGEKKKKEGHIFKTSKLKNCEYIITLPTSELLKDRNQNNTADVLRDMMNIIHRAANQQELKSIALPFIGTGATQMPSEMMIPMIIDTILAAFEQPGTVENIVLIDIDEEKVNTAKRYYTKLTADEYKDSLLSSIGDITSNKDESRRLQQDTRVQEPSRVNHSQSQNVGNMPSNSFNQGQSRTFHNGGSQGIRNQGFINEHDFRPHSMQFTTPPLNNSHSVYSGNGYTPFVRDSKSFQGNMRYDDEFSVLMNIIPTKNLNGFGMEHQNSRLFESGNTRSLVLFGGNNGGAREILKEEGKGIEEDEDTKWQWFDADYEEWKDYEPKKYINRKINAHISQFGKTGQKEFIVKKEDCDGTKEEMRYLLNFTRMVQINPVTKFERRIRQVKA